MAVIRISLIGEFPEDKCSTNFTVINTNLTNTTDKYISLADEFGINCESSGILDHANGVFMIGNFMAAPFSTYLADRYGRRLTFLIPLWIIIFLTIACAFSPTFLWFLIFRFLSGACGAAVMVVGFVITVEAVAGSFRSIQALLNALIWVFGIFSVGILHHYYIKNWRYLYLFIAFPGLISIVYYKVFPESLHWLIANKKTEEIRKYIIKSSKMNKTNINLNICRTEQIIENGVVVVDCLEEKTEETLKSETFKTPPKRNFFDLFRRPSYTFHLTLNCYIFIVLNFLYWALTLYSVDLHKNKMVGFFLSAVVEIPAGIISMILLMVCGRRTVTIISLTGQAISLGLTIFTPRGTTLNLLLSLFAKVMNTVAWASAPLLLSEMAPTTIRNMSYGFVSTIGEVGSVLAPYMKRIGDENKQKGIIALMSILAVLVSMMAPETVGKSLPQDLDDFDSGPFINCIKKCCRAISPTKREDKRKENGKLSENVIFLEEKREDDELKENAH
uniref:Major facilitator superfamily (MFS) profile domain-containing protein n=1 Tax=Meloidogyne incognita TaxID=6306 RepID=A0A914MK65_MELIC